MADHPRWVRKFLSEVDLDAVREAIAEAESRTSAEIRVHLDHRCPGDAIARAVVVFRRLGMDRTADGNGVLVYIATADRKLAVIGDRGIHARVGPGYWQELVTAVTTRFRNEQPRDGLIHAVGELGAALAWHFPRRPDDDNELRDEVSIG